MRGPSASDDPPRADGAAPPDGTTACVEEDDVDRESHAEGVNRAATLDQQASACLPAIEEGEPEQARAPAAGDSDLAAQDPRYGQPADAIVAVSGHATDNPVPQRGAPAPLLRGGQAQCAV